MKTSTKRIHIFCYLKMAMPHYAMTTGKRLKRPLKIALLPQLRPTKTVIEHELASLPVLNITPLPGFFDQIPIAETALLTPTTSQTTAVSHIKA